MKTIKLLLFGFLLATLSLTSCGKDEEEQQQQQDVVVYDFEYDNQKYEVNDGLLIYNEIYSFIFEKNILGSFTIVLIDGEFYEQDPELISTNTQHGIYFEVDITSEELDSIDQLSLEGMTLPINEGEFFYDIVSYEDNIIESEIEYGFPDEFTSIITSENAGSITIDKYQFNSEAATASIECSYTVNLENGKTASGTFKGEVQVTD